MSQGFEITFHNRKENKRDIEKIYGDSMIRFAYDSFIGKMLSPIVSSRSLSKIYGSTQDTLKSGRKVPQFVKDFNIDLSIYNKGSLEADKAENSYKSFNEFFIRTFKDGQREFTEDKNKLAACAEARYFGHEAIKDDLVVPVKGTMIKATDLIGNEKLAKDFIGGPFVIARLCPVDYHRYHYPDSGKTIESFLVPGEFHSVNPIALKYKELAIKI